MTWDRRKEEALALLYQGRRADEIAKLVGVQRRTLASWFVQPEFLAKARREFIAGGVELLPVALDRLRALVDAESEATALAAVKTVIRLAELAAAAEGQREEFHKRLAVLLDGVLDEVLKKDEGDVFRFAAACKENDEHGPDREADSEA